VREEEKKAAPILIADLFPEVRRELLQALQDLSPAEWERQTAAPLRSVKDVALPLLGGDVSNLSRRPFAFRLPGKPIADYRDLVAFLDEWNAQ
jgi:uncharacterized protein (DUF2336 family)